MTHRFPIKEIALQAGLGTATVDRVLNGRAHVSPQTRRRVEDAIIELEQQVGQLAARGRRLFFDVVMEAPNRFSREVRHACETVLTDLRPTSIRPRFTFIETMSSPEFSAILQRIEKRGSQGVCLKVRDTDEVRQAIAGLAERRIPVVTVFTDIPGSERLAYVGLDNRSAGKTAAYLMHKLLPAGGTVLTTLSQHAFQGEEERYEGFRQELGRLRPECGLVDASGGGGLNPETRREVTEKLVASPPISGVYSMGGGNRAILQALSEADQMPSVYVAHDLDKDNLDLLRQERLTLVLHHDLLSDMQTAFRHLLAYHGIGTSPSTKTSDVQVVTPLNIPSRFNEPD
ncbi:LacI family DNA-binding transcriptional regulator [Roseibium sp. LAB1]